MLTLTEAFNGMMPGYFGISHSFTGTSDHVMIQSGFKNVSVAIHPAPGQTARVEYTLSCRADIDAGNAKWMVWHRHDECQWGLVGRLLGGRIYGDPARSGDMQHTGNDGSIRGERKNLCKIHDRRIRGSCSADASGIGRIIGKPRRSGNIGRHCGNWQVE